MYSLLQTSSCLHWPPCFLGRNNVCSPCTGLWLYTENNAKGMKMLEEYILASDINCMALSIVYLLVSKQFAFCWFSFICTSWVFLRLDIATYSWLFFFIWYLTVIIHRTFLGFAKFCRLLYLKTEQVQLFTVEQCNVSASNSYRITIRFSRLPLKIQLIPLPSKSLL